MQFWCVSCILGTFFDASNAFPMLQMLTNQRPSVADEPSSYLENNIAEMVKIKLADESHRQYQALTLLQRSTKHDRYGHPLPSDVFIEPNQDVSVTEGDIVVEMNNGDSSNDEYDNTPANPTLGGPSLFAHFPTRDTANKYSIKRNTLHKIYQG